MLAIAIKHLLGLPSGSGSRSGQAGQREAQRMRLEGKAGGDGRSPPPGLGPWKDLPRGEVL